jgi:SAM-dependent MidA family methyltransferase
MDLKINELIKIQYFFANEFFDALPIKQFIKKKIYGMKDLLI